MGDEGNAPSDSGTALARSLDEFRRQLEFDPLLPTAEMRRMLDAIADDVLEMFPADGEATAGT